MTDYEAIQTENTYYVDKTAYLEKIEKAGKYLFFIRPSRFGKSLFLSVMETYYDISKENRFDLFYKGTAVHRELTREKNKYLVLKFNFSAVDPHSKRLENSLKFPMRQPGGCIMIILKKHMKRPVLENTSLIKLVLVFSGTELKYIGPVDV